MAKQRAKTTDPLSMGGSDEHDVGIDPHRKTLTATVLDGRGGIYHDARRHGHTKKEAIRILKRHLSNVVYRRMIHDLNATLNSPPVDTRQAAA